MRPLSCAVACTPALEQSPRDIKSKRRYLFVIVTPTSQRRTYRPFIYLRGFNGRELSALTAVKQSCLDGTRRRSPAWRAVGRTSPRALLQRSSRPYGESAREPGD